MMFAIIWFDGIRNVEGLGRAMPDTDDFMISGMHHKNCGFGVHGLGPRLSYTTDVIDGWPDTEDRPPVGEMTAHSLHILLF
jgi:hypothetical protein